MQACVGSVTEKAMSSEKGESTCPSSLLAGTSAILPPAASKIGMLNCASKALIWPLTATGLVTESPAAGKKLSAPGLAPEAPSVRAYGYVTVAVGPEDGVAVEAFEHIR